MGDHFVLIVDRLLTESTIETANGRKNQSEQGQTSGNNDGSTTSTSDGGDLSPCKLVQCRICHDEDEDSNLETPCSCSGSLKYAHRRCVQRWCNEKGDTTCEICLQQFRPGYTAPRRLFHYSNIPLNFRGNWGISGMDLHNPYVVIPAAAADRDLLDPNFDEYSAHSPRSLIYCRIVAILFMLLLFLRQSLPIILSGAGCYSFAAFMLLLLRTIGIVLPVYIMVKVFTSCQRRRRLQDPRFSIFTSDEENESPQAPQPQPRFVPVQ